MPAVAPPSADPPPATGRVARNSVLQAGADAIGKVGTIVLYAVMAREAGVLAFGDFTTAASLSILLMVAALGMDYRITRLVARGEPVGDAFWSAILLKLTLGVALLAVLCVITIVGPYDDRVILTTVLLGVAILVELAMLTPHAIFRGREELRPVAVALILYRGTLSVAGAAVLLAGGSIVAVAYGWLVSAVLALVYSAGQLRARGLHFPVRVTWQSLRTVGADSIGLGLAGILGATLARLDIVLLGFLKDSEAVALYGGAYRLMESTQFLTTALALAAFPALARLSRTTTPSVADATTSATKVVLVLTCPIAVLFVAYAGPLLRGVYGAQFVDGADSLQLLGPVVILAGVVSLVTFMISSQGHQRPIVFALATATAANLAANVLLIPPLGIEGAALAWVITSVVTCGALAVPALRVTGPLPLARIVTGPGVASAAMAATAFGLGAGALSVIPACVAFVVVLALVELILFPADVARVMARLRRRPADA